MKFPMTLIFSLVIFCLSSIGSASLISNKAACAHKFKQEALSLYDHCGHLCKDLKTGEEVTYKKHSGELSRATVTVSYQSKTSGNWQPVTDTVNGIVTLNRAGCIVHSVSVSDGEE